MPPGLRTKEFIRANKDKIIFVYSSNLLGFPQDLDWVLGMLEPNCFPVVTMMCPTKQMYFSDEQFEKYKFMIDAHIGRIPRDGREIQIFPPAGKGKAKMDEKCPKLYAYLQEQLKALGKILDD